MASSIMISGPHAIGKTTTAQKINLALAGSVFVASPAGRIAKEMGYDIDANPSIEEVVKYQEAVLKSLTESFEALEKTDYVCDRSPLDLAAYMCMSHMDDESFDEIACEYINKCIALTDKHCDYLIIPMADTTDIYEEKEGRPKFTEEQINFRNDFYLVLGALVPQLSRTMVLVVPSVYQYDDRFNFIKAALESIEDE